MFFSLGDTEGPLSVVSVRPLNVTILAHFFTKWCNVTCPRLVKKHFQVHRVQVATEEHSVQFEPLQDCAFFCTPCFRIFVFLPAVWRKKGWCQLAKSQAARPEAACCWNVCLTRKLTTWNAWSRGCDLCRRCDVSVDSEHLNFSCVFFPAGEEDFCPVLPCLQISDGYHPSHEQHNCRLSRAMVPNWCAASSEPCWKTDGYWGKTPSWNKITLTHRITAALTFLCCHEMEMPLCHTQVTAEFMYVGLRCENICGGPVILSGSKEAKFLFNVKFVIWSDTGFGC